MFILLFFLKLNTNLPILLMIKNIAPSPRFTSRGERAGRTNLDRLLSGNVVPIRYIHPKQKGAQHGKKTTKKSLIDVQGQSRN